jgi:hypothetical protein
VSFCAARSTPPAATKAGDLHLKLQVLERARKDSTRTRDADPAGLDLHLACKPLTQNSSGSWNVWRLRQTYSPWGW